VQFAPGNGPRLILSIEGSVDHLADAVDKWLAVAAPHATYCVAEVANPTREHGDPSFVIAIEPGAADELESVIATLVCPDSGNLTYSVVRLHLATR
jgi:hypothetical protein